MYQPRCDFVDRAAQFRIGQFFDIVFPIPQKSIGDGVRAIDGELSDETRQVGGGFDDVALPGYGFVGGTTEMLM
jgi:hypothetical protein